MSSDMGTRGRYHTCVCVLCVRARACVYNRGRSRVLQRRQAEGDRESKTQRMERREIKQRLRVDGYPERANSVPGYGQSVRACVSQWRSHLENSMKEASYDLSGSGRDVSMTCLGRSHPRCPHYWDGDESKSAP